MHYNTPTTTGLYDHQCCEYVLQENIYPYVTLFPKYSCFDYANLQRGLNLVGDATHLIGKMHPFLRALILSIASTTSIGYITCFFVIFSKDDEDSSIYI